MRCIKWNDITVTPKQLPVAGDVELIVVKYLKYLRNIGRAENTINAYKGDLEQFLGFCIEYGVRQLGAVTAEFMDQFVARLIASGSCAPRTAARKLEVVRSMSRWAESRSMIATDICKGVDPVQFTRAPAKAPPMDALKTFIESIKTDEGSAKQQAIALRDKTIFTLFLDSALRASGLCGLDIRTRFGPEPNAYVAKGAVRYLGKDGQYQVCVIEPHTNEMVDDWLAVRHKLKPKDGTQALFINAQGKRISRHAVWGAGTNLGQGFESARAAPTGLPSAAPKRYCISVWPSGSTNPGGPRQPEYHSGYLRDRKRRAHGRTDSQICTAVWSWSVLVLGFRRGEAAMVGDTKVTLVRGRTNTWVRPTLRTGV